jgi:sulfatase modifying factor 1
MLKIHSLQRRLRLLFLCALLPLISASVYGNLIIDTVSIGDANNASDPTTGRGSVSYNYQIGTYQVTNAQYAAFLNAVDPNGANNLSLFTPLMSSNARGGILYDATAASGTRYSTKANMGNKPVNYISFWRAARFTNWLSNGQGNGDTETGVYNLGGVISPNNASVTRDLTYGYGTQATVWALPSEDEWYKAAFFDASLNDGSGGYWLYPTRSNSVPSQAFADANGNISNTGSNVVNYGQAANWNGVTGGNLTTVGSAGPGSESYYGTSDQGGNTFEWTEDIFFHDEDRGMRGATYRTSWFDGILLAANRSFHGNPAFGGDAHGFRVVGLEPIPEPSSYAAILACFGLFLVLTRRRFSNSGQH